MRKLIPVSFLSLVLLCACGSDNISSADTDETTTFISHDTIPQTRDSVSITPIATFVSTKGDKLVVNIYETKAMFQFLMKMEYQNLDEPDTLRIPNFGIRPKIVIQKGEDGKSCIVGFLDKKKEFKEYKMVTVKTGNLQVKVLKRYFAGVYRTVLPDTATAR